MAPTQFLLRIFFTGFFDDAFYNEVEQEFIKTMIEVPIFWPSASFEKSHGFH